MKKTYGLSIFAALLLPFLWGCAGSSIAVPTPGPPGGTSGSTLHGAVYAGQQPVAGSSIVLYAASVSGYNTASTNLLSNSVTTATDGSFSTASFNCVSGQQLYLVANGGTINGVTNSSAAFMTALGDCSSLASGTFITMNEVTTVGSVYALAQFMTGSTAVSTGPNNKLGLANAFLLVNNLVNVSTGVAAGSTLPSGATAPISKLNTLADVLYGCNGIGGAACTALFKLATPSGGSTPGNTVDALLAIALHPALNVSPLYKTVTRSPFTPLLSSAPPDWTMSVGYSGGGLHLPAALAIDSTGSVWAANSAAVATKLSPIGQPAAASGFASTALNESYGIAVDGQDSVWITSQESPGVSVASGTVTKFSSSGQLLSGNGFTAGGINYPVAIAADSSGNMWVADYGRTGATLLAPNGSSLSGTSGFTSPNVLYPVSVAVDSSNGAWLGTDGAVTHITPAGVVTPYSCCHDAPSGVALDAAGNVWLTDYLASALLELNANGTILQTLTSVGGLYYPQALAIDGSGTVWVVNYQGNTISSFSAGPVSNTLSPSGGYGADAALAQPSSVAIDASGNLWIANAAANTVTEFVGLAAPVRTPQAGPVAKP